MITKKITRIISRLTLILAGTLFLFQCVSPGKLKKNQMAMYDGVNQYLTDRVLPNPTSYPLELGNVINSIDTALLCIMHHSKENDNFVSYGREIPNLCLLIYSDGMELRDRLIILYESDTVNYKLIKEQFPISQKSWYSNYFLFKSTTEVLLELSVLKQQLLIAYTNSDEQTTRANKP